MTTPSAETGPGAVRTGALPLPQGPLGLPPQLRVLQLIDSDCVSHGMAGWRGLEGRPGSDTSYAPVITRLRQLGTPTWLVAPGRHAAALSDASCAVSFTRRPHPARTSGQRTDYLLSSLPPAKEKTMGSFSDRNRGPASSNQEEPTTAAELVIMVLLDDQPCTPADGPQD